MRCSVSLVWWFAKWCSLPSFAQLDDVRQAYTAALAFLATRTETRFLFARLPPAVRDDIRFSGCKISFVTLLRWRRRLYASFRRPSVKHFPNRWVGRPWKLRSRTSSHCCTKISPSIADNA